MTIVTSQEELNNLTSLLMARFMLNFSQYEMPIEFHFRYIEDGLLNKSEYYGFLTRQILQQKGGVN